MFNASNTVVVATHGSSTDAATLSNGICTYTGTAIPRPSDENIVNAIVTLGASCSEKSKALQSFATTAFSTGATLSLNAFTELLDRSDAFFVSTAKR